MPAKVTGSAFIARLLKVEFTAETFHSCSAACGGRDDESVVRLPLFHLMSQQVLVLLLLQVVDHLDVIVGHLLDLIEPLPLFVF